MTATRRDPRTTGSLRQSKRPRSKLDLRMAGPRREKSAVEEHDAAVTCAEAAIAGGWEAELGLVLDVLGLAGGS